MNRIFVLFVTLFYSSNSINIPQRYLEQCENTNSTEIGKCLNSTDNCEIFLGCMAEIQCKPIDEDYKNQLDSCWKSVFMEKFGECRKKLIEAKANCQKDKLKNMTQNPELRACNNIRDSKTCMKQKIGKFCGAEDEKEYVRYSKIIYEGSNCYNLTGLEF